MLTSEDQQIIQETIKTIIDGALQRISIMETHSESFSSSDSGLTSPVTVLAVDDRSETSQSTFQQEKDSSYDQDTFTSEMTNVTWTDLVEGKSEEINETPTAISTANAIETTPVPESTEGPIQRSSYESDSVRVQMFEFVTHIGRLFI